MTAPPDAPPIPAATVVVMRDRAAAPPELLMVERSAAMAFAGGALVFPGGRIDPGDRAYAAMLDVSDMEDAAGRVAAVREAIEETGVAPGLPATLDIGDVRQRLHDGASIGEVLDTQTIDLAALELFARWCPRMAGHRIFDTLFYLARMPEGAPAPRVDATENTRLLWASARDVLAQADAGRVTIIFPTRRNLERLAQYGSFAEAVAAARAYPIRTVTPWVEERDGERHLCIPDDLGYPVTSEPLTSALRG